MRVGKSEAVAHELNHDGGARQGSQDSHRPLGRLPRDNSQLCTLLPMVGKWLDCQFRFVRGFPFCKVKGVYMAYLAARCARCAHLGGEVNSFIFLCISIESMICIVRWRREWDSNPR